MTSRSTLLPVAFAAALTLASCGGDSDGSSAPSDPPATDVSDDAAGDEANGEATDDTDVGANDAGADTIAGDDAANTEPDSATETDAGDDAAGDGCDQVLTPTEIEAIFGVAPTINGQGERCTLVFADDAVGGLAVFSGAKADEAIATLLAEYESDEYKTTNGELLPDGRGYIVDGSLVVRGDSGRVFSVGIPENLDTSDYSAAMQNLADLLLTR